MTGMAEFNRETLTALLSEADGVLDRARRASLLLDAAIMSLVERDVPAVEAFGWRTDFFARADVDELLEGPVGAVLRSASEIGLMSVSVLESAGLKVVACPSLYMSGDDFARRMAELDALEREL